MDNFKKFKKIKVIGYDTYFSEEKDIRGSYLLIAIPQNADRDISDICGKVIANHLITEIDYTTIESAKGAYSAYMRLYVVRNYRRCHFDFGHWFFIITALSMCFVH